MFCLCLLLIWTGLLEWRASTHELELGVREKAHPRDHPDLPHRCPSLLFAHKKKSVLPSAYESTLLKCDLLLCKNGNGNK